MRITTEEQFAKHSKEKALCGVCFLYGAESYLVEAWRKRLLSRFGGESFNFQRLDGRRPDLDALYDATQMLPLFAEQKCVLLDDLEPGKLGADDLAKLMEIFAETPEECFLIVTARPPHFDPKSAAGKKLMAAADKSGLLVELSTRDTAGMVRFLQQTGKSHGCEISAPLCREVLRMCGADMNALSGEMAKLCAYAGGGAIEQRHLDAVLTPKTEARVYDLGKMILAGNPQRAMEILRDLFYLREAPIAVLAALITGYVDLYRARAAKDTGVSAPEVVSRFGYKGREFRVNNAFGARISLPALRRSLQLLAECDRAMKSSGADDQILLERTVVALIGARGL